MNMNGIEDYDLVVLGSGAGDKCAALTLGGRVEKVAVIERNYIGGSCPNIACLPSKNVVHSAKVAWYVRHSREFGINSDSFRVDMPAVRERKRRMVTGLGTGKFVGERTVEVTLPDRENAAVARQQGRDRNRHARRSGADSRPRRRAAPHARRGARAGRGSGAPVGDRRRLRRHGVLPGLPSLRPRGTGLT